ncbi:hypothetical protein ESB13_02560 [Filimonas effusa]|uniref:Uncharacterized protein n=1 Tax=Filimonas effusa TaxID=2508721 RepID=A0A4Q1D8N7_9BACT|nr:hypothetical protein ESB13_02560 [Filimonas effusa]
MSKSYYVSNRAQPDGYHEVHNEDCQFLPSVNNRDHLGIFTSCYPAVAAARAKYDKVDGCKFCSPGCHTR